MAYDSLRYVRKLPDGFVDAEAPTLSSQLILEEAERHGVAWQQIKGTRMFRLTRDDVVRYFYAQVPPTTTYYGYYIASFKHVTKVFLQDAGVSSPKGFLLMLDDQERVLRSVFEALRLPVLVKPNRGSQGASIIGDIRTYEDYSKAVAQLFDEKIEEVLVEEMFDGKEYRVLASSKKIIGITHRVPANVVGDGVQTIEKLIAIKNADPRRSGGRVAALYPIEIDDELHAMLKEQALSITSVLEKGKKAVFRKTSNLHRGGDSIDYTDIVHPSVQEICLEAMQALPGLNWAGIDFMSKDITVDQRATPDHYIVLEVNHTPGLSMQDEPFEGTKRHAARAFFYELFPELRL